MRFSLLGYSALTAVLIAGSAQANGFSRGTADTDILYDDGNFTFRAGAIYVTPSHKLESTPTAAPNPAIEGHNYLENYIIPTGAVKFGFTENLACAGTFTTPYGANSSYDSFYGPSGKLLEEFTVAEFGATCAVFLPVGPGRLAILGGAFIESFDYTLEAEPLLLGGAPLSVDLDSRAYGWRAGIGYEIPEYAFRAELMYRSGTTHDATGSGVFIHPVFGPVPLSADGNGELPQSVELKLQSGIAPGWLAFGSVKWTDWSVNETLDLSVSNPAVGTIDSLNQYYWDDSWTITAGVGHAFTEKVSGSVLLQWDQGVSTGFDLRGDKWMVAAGASFKDSLGGELRLGAGAVHLASVDIDDPTAINAGASADSGWAGIFSASYKVKW
ncbi:OmpP1/FadL family transporter [Chelativorans alearense]|uniref:OmpP1/FadL family transporter n=1 Tax=Chelativorans alearense TaxID=2681495 RepID=UPI0013D04E77|nr:aromatic hydrocarbon degradation protein [Chelativorans alearense]